VRWPKQANGSRYSEVWIEYNKPVSRFLRGFAVLVISQTILALAHAQTTAVIPDNLAASHVCEYVTVEGVVAKVFTSKSGNTFLNIGAAYPNQTLTGRIPPASHHVGCRATLASR
jgi:hypothetical protein